MTIPQDAVEIHGAWISAVRAVEFLQRRGWETRGERPGIYLRLIAPSTSVSDTTVVIPLNPATGDFRVLLEDALAGIAYATGLGTQRLLVELDIGMGDKIRFRKEMPSPHGSIPWRAGENLVASSTKILEAAAKSEREKAQYFGNKHWTTARAYLDEVRMGQTEMGSYIVTALTPRDVLPGVEVPLPGFGEAPTGRDVTRTLASGLEATRNAIDEYNRSTSLTPFIEAVQHGLSYEMARGLVGVVEQSDGADIIVELSQERTQEASLVTVEFEPSDIGALRRAATQFSQTEPSQLVVVLGMVTLLSRPSLGTPGVVRLDVIEGSQAKKLRVRMPEDLYDIAIRAHREGMALHVAGRQEKEGQLYWLYDPDRPTLVDPSSLPAAPLRQPDDDGEYLI